jgi:xanthine dehydrogenase small subunit
VIKFILNDKEVSYTGHPGVVMLDFIRYQKNLTGTKIGCREGDCGACTVLVGELLNGKMRYRSMTSCLLPMANAHGKHIVSIEGVNMDVLNPVQQAMSDESATQCGFCTPGFVMSLAGFCLREDVTDFPKEALAAVDGNICRCTGYKSIERAVLRVADLCSKRGQRELTEFVATEKILPDYFASIKVRMTALAAITNGETSLGQTDFIVSGGTDLYVQKHDVMPHSNLQFVFNDPALKSVIVENGKCTIGASATVTDLVESKPFRNAFPDFEKYYRLVSSTPIRNMATIAGNIVNASPIGDFTAFFLALDAEITLKKNKTERTIKLKDFYLGYKKLDKQNDEVVSKISVILPSAKSRFNFEKVCKRTNLDIASVNTAMMIELENDVVTKSHLSAGGVGPTPMYLRKSVEFLKGKKISVDVIDQLLSVVQSEISPISDARGTAEYKRTLLSQLIKAHFTIWYPELLTAEFIAS